MKLDEMIPMRQETVFTLGMKMQINPKRIKTTSTASKAPTNVLNLFI